MMNAVFSSESTNAGISVVIGIFVARLGLLAARRVDEEVQLAAPRLLEHERLQRHLRPVVRLAVVDLAVEQRLQRHVVDLRQRRAPSRTGSGTSTSPTTTWFGGIDGRPSALRVSDSTITIRVKLVSITSSAGAIASTVSSRMMTTLCPGFFWSLPSSAAEVDRDRRVVASAVGRRDVLGRDRRRRDASASAGAVGRGAAPRSAIRSPAASRARTPATRESDEERGATAQRVLT